MEHRKLLENILFDLLKVPESPLNKYCDYQIQHICRQIGVKEFGDLKDITFYKQFAQHFLNYLEQMNEIQSIIQDAIQSHTQQNIILDDQQKFKHNNQQHQHQNSIQPKTINNQIHIIDDDIQEIPKSILNLEVNNLKSNPLPNFNTQIHSQLIQQQQINQLQHNNNKKLIQNQSDSLKKIEPKPYPIQSNQTKKNKPQSQFDFKKQASTLLNKIEQKQAQYNKLNRNTSSSEEKQRQQLDIIKKKDSKHTQNSRFEISFESSDQKNLDDQSQSKESKYLRRNENKKFPKNLNQVIKDKLKSKSKEQEKSLEKKLAKSKEKKNKEKQEKKDKNEKIPIPKKDKSQNQKDQQNNDKSEKNQIQRIEQKDIPKILKTVEIIQNEKLAPLNQKDKEFNQIDKEIKDFLEKDKQKKQSELQKEKDQQSKHQQEQQDKEKKKQLEFLEQQKHQKEQEKIQKEQLEIQKQQKQLLDSKKQQKEVRDNDVAICNIIERTDETETNKFQSNDCQLGTEIIQNVELWDMVGKILCNNEQQGIKVQSQSQNQKNEQNSTNEKSRKKKDKEQIKIDKSQCYYCQNGDIKNIIEIQEGIKICSNCLLVGLNPLQNIISKICSIELRCTGKEGGKISQQFSIDQNLGSNLEIRCIALNKNNIFDFTFPMNCTISINGISIKEFKPLQEKSSLKKRKDQSILLSQKELEKLNSLTNYNQKKMVFQCVEHSTDQGFRKDQVGTVYCFGLFQVQQFTVNQAVERFINLDIKPKFNNDQSKSEIKIEKYKVSLICQFSSDYMSIPAKGEFCQHKQCFCLQNYLEIMSKAEHRKWCCPICKKLCFYMVIDKYQKFVISRVKQLEVAQEHIVLDQNGQLDKDEEINKILQDDSIKNYSDIITRNYKNIQKIERQDDAEDEQNNEITIKNNRDFITIDD